jgi:hypothetical protein
LALRRNQARQFIGARSGNLPERYSSWSECANALFPIVVTLLPKVILVSMEQ